MAILLYDNRFVKFTIKITLNNKIWASQEKEEILNFQKYPRIFQLSKVKCLDYRGCYKVQGGRVYYVQGEGVCKVQGEKGVFIRYNGKF